MFLDPSAFNRHLNHMGQRFDFRKAAACPCLDQYTNSPRVDCARCKGIGWLWGAPTVGMSGIASQKVQREWATFGLWESGDVVLTIPSDSPVYGMGSYDRVLMLDSTEAFSFVRKRGVNDTGLFPVTQIDRVFWLDSQQRIVECDAPTIGDNYILSWSGNVPSNGQQYSMTGRRHPEYYVFHEMSQDRAHHSGRDLPRRVVLRRFEILARSGLTQYASSSALSSGSSTVLGVTN